VSASGRLPPLGVLLVEDNPADARLLAESFKEVGGVENIVIRTVRTLAEACAEMSRYSFTCVLVDLGLPDGRGVGNVEALRAIDRRAAIIVLTGNDDEHLAAEAIRLGAQEYLIKGHLDGAKMVRLLRHAIERNKHVHELEDQRHREFHRASHDSLTGLANRELFYDRVRQLLAQSQRAGRAFAICYLDLDGFKRVNDQHGHQIGDQLLIRVAEVLNESVRATDTVARVGGDEFLVLLWPVEDHGEAGVIAHRLRERVMAIRQIGDHVIDLDASVGVVFHPQHGDTLDELLERGDRAMYQAKRGGGGVAIYDAQDVDSPARAADIKVELSDALENDQFLLLFHPWVNAVEQRFVGVEALLRWNRGDGVQRPDEFLRSAESSGYLVEIGLHVAVKAFYQWHAWRAQGIVADQIAINLSAIELADDRLVPSLLAVAEAAGVKPGEVRLEVPMPALEGETSHRIITHLRRARDQGFGVVLDQFGPDGQSLKWLTAVQFDGLKLGRHVLRALNEEGLQGSMRRFTTAVLGAASALGVPVIATGVESVDDRVMLQMMGCVLMQGQLFCGFESAGDLPARLAMTPAGL
jgi:diguanylate cyclase (GGDEF)-like protein